MKQARLSLFAVILLAVVSPSLEAQGPGRPTLGIYGGIASPRGVLGDEAGNGWNAGVLLKMRVFKALDLRVDGAYAKFAALDFDIPIASGDTAFGHLDAKVPFGTLNIHLNLGPDSAEYPGDNTVSPYVLTGIGIYKLDYQFTCEGTCSAIETIPTENHFGLNLGGGASIPIFGLKAFVEGRYHRISQKSEFGDDRSFITISAGLRIR
jgi:opacity protein-like surface antigen